MEPPPARVTASSHRLLSVSDVTLALRVAFMTPFALASTAWANTRAATVAPTPVEPEIEMEPAQFTIMARSAAWTRMSAVPDVDSASSASLSYPAIIVAFFASVLISFLVTNVLMTPTTAVLLLPPPDTAIRMISSLPVAPT